METTGPELTTAIQFQKESKAVFSTHHVSLTLSLRQRHTEYVLYQITQMLWGRTQCILSYSGGMNTTAHGKNNQTAYK